MKNNGRYVDGFVLIVPKKQIAAYSQMAKVAGKVWRKYGALEYKECMLDDAKPKWKDKPMPFDMKRMSYGGFNVMVDA